MKYVLSHKLLFSVVISLLFCVLILPITEAIWFTHDTLTKESFLYSLLMKTLFGIFITIIVFFGLHFYQQIKQKNKLYQDWVKKSALYGAVLFIILLLIFPGYWLWDEFFILEQSHIYAVYGWQSIFTQAQYIFSLYLIPSSTGVTILQLITISIIVGYILAWVKKLYPQYPRLWIAAFVPFLLPVVLFGNFFTLRLHIYGYLLLLLVIKIIIIYKTDKPKSPAYAHFIGFAALVTLLAFWRTEGIIYLATLPFVAHRLGLFTEIFRKNTLKLAATITLSIILLLSGFLATKLTDSPRYKITAFVNPLSMMIHEDLRGSKINTAWEEVDSVINLDTLKKYPSFTEIPAMWRSNDEPILQDNFEDHLGEFYRGVSYIIAHNPDTFIKYRMKTFLTTNGLAENPYATSTGWLTPFSTDGCQDLGEQQCSALTNFAQSNKFNHSFNPILRKSVLNTLLIKTDEHSKTQQLLRAVLWDTLPVIIGLLFIALHSLFTKKWLWLSITSLLLLQTALIFGTAPASYFMYYFPVYLAGIMTILMYVLPSIASRLSSKNKKRNKDIISTMTTPNQKVLIAIPAYNCAPQITRVLKGIDKKLQGRIAEVAVIDNGSTDNTIERALEFKKTAPYKSKLHIYKNNDNYNLGGTHKVAFLKAEKEGFTHVVILHGDDQAKSSEVNDLLDYAEGNPQQTVLGSRFSKDSRLEGYDLKRILGNKVLNIIFSVITLRKLEDLGSGINLFYLKDLDKKTYLKFADKLTFNYELILDLVKRKVNFAFLPITWSEEDQVSNARNVTIFKTALVNVIRWRINKPTVNETRKTYSCKEVK